jgi:hypothetical protein
MSETNTSTGQSPRARYIRRIVDDELDELIAGLPAIAIEGPKAVGKTATALQRAATVYRLDDEAERSIAEADPSRLIRGQRPVLIDEWQRRRRSSTVCAALSTNRRPPEASC